MSEPSSPDEAAVALWDAMLFDDTVDNETRWKEIAAQAFRERDRRIRAEERERCARIARSYRVPPEARIPSVGDAIDTTAQSIAAAIEKIGESEERTSARIEHPQSDPASKASVPSCC